MRGVAERHLCKDINIPSTNQDAIASLLRTLLLRPDLAQHILSFHGHLYPPRNNSSQRNRQRGFNNLLRRASSPSNPAATDISQDDEIEDMLSSLANIRTLTLYEPWEPITRRRRHGGRLRKLVDGLIPSRRYYTDHMLFGTEAGYRSYVMMQNAPFLEVPQSPDVATTLRPESTCVPTACESREAEDSVDELEFGCGCCKEATCLRWLLAFMVA